MALKQIPKIWLYVYPLQTTGGFVNITPFSVADIVSQSQANMVPDQNLRLWDLHDKTSGLRTVGYTLKPLPGHMNAMIGRTLRPGTSDPVLDFTPLRGKRWQTVIPDAQPRTTAIKWATSDPDDGPFEARSASALPRGQSFAIQLQTFGYHADDAYLQITWGEGYGIRLEGGQNGALIRQFRADDGTLQYESLRELPFGVEQLSAPEPVWLRVHHIAGRIAIETEPGVLPRGEDGLVVYANMKTEGLDPDRASYKMRGVVPREAPLQIRGYAVPFSARFSEINYPESGAFTRTYTQGGGEPYSRYAFGFHPAPTRAEGGPEASLGDIAQVSVGLTEDNRNYYSCALSRAGAGATTQTTEDAPSDWETAPMAYTGQAMGGHLTPFVHAVTVRYPGAIRQPLGVALELSPAVVSLDMEIADPEIAPGTIVRAKCHRDLISQCHVYDLGLNDLGAVGSAWGTFLAKYHRARMSCAWQYDDGTTGVVDPTGATYAYAPMFDGYVWSLAPDLTSYGERWTNIEFRDGVIRLQKPAGLIDWRFGPADMLLAEKMANAPSADCRLYGAEIVQHIIEQSMGGEAAAALQVRFPADHYDLLQHKMLLDPPFGAGFFWPAQYGQSALDWIKQVAAADFGNFFFGPRTSAPYDWVPYYGWYYSIVAGMPTIEVPDTAYVEADANKVLASAGWQQQPAQDFNVVQVWGRFPQDPGEYREFMPALPQISGAAHVAPTTVPEQDLWATWQRTLLLQGTQYWLPGVARAVASNRARLQRNVDPRRLPLKVRGDPYWWWGYQVIIRADAPQSDPDLWVPGEKFRVMRLSHRMVFGQQGTWETSLVAVPEGNLT